MVAFLSFSLGNAQIKVSIDSVDLSIDSTKFKKRASDKNFYEYVPQSSNELLPSQKGKSKVLSKTANTTTLAINPMSLSQIPTNYTIDKSKGVGEIPISSNVTMGAVTHTVPIKTYETAGMSPGLSLSYNSSARSGAIGYGWGIGGPSLISATHGNYYYDGSSYKPLSLDKTANFSLDGARLIKISETTTQITYQTEQGNIKVVSYIPSGKFYFDVYFPNGRVGTFGEPTNTGSFKIYYPMTKLVDLEGNFINYSYTESYNTYYLTRVDYGKGTTNVGFVTFTYKSISDGRTAYLAGRETRDTKLLTEINSNFQSVLMCTYTLTYKKDQYDFLSQISCKMGTQELNPLLFYYGGGDSSATFQTDIAFLESYFANSKAPDLVLNKGKFNGQITSDGLVAYPRFEVFGVSGYDNSGNCTYESRYATDQTLLIYKNLGSYICTPEKTLTGRGFQGLYPVDYNGDGDDELVRVNYWLENSSQANLNITTYDRNMTASSRTFLLEGTFSEGSRVSAVPRTFLTGNFLGDGKTQLIAISSYKMPKRQNGSAGEVRSWSRTTMINLENRSKAYDATPFKFDYFKDAVFAIDYNGDGRTDICLVNADGTYIYSYQDGTFKQIGYTNSLKNTALSGSLKKELLIGEINGDGLIDFLLSPAKNCYWTERVEYPCGECAGCTGGNLDPNKQIFAPIAQSSLNSITQDNHSHEYANQVELPKDTVNAFSPDILLQPIDPDIGVCLNPFIEYIRHYYDGYRTWTVLLNTGTTFVSSTFDFLSNSDGDLKLILEDINGDQLSDLLVKSSTTIYAYLNENGSISTTAERATATVNSDSHFITGGIGDGLYGNGRPSHILSIKDATVTPITFSRDDARERMMTGVINSLGVVTQYNYSNLTSGNNYSTIPSNTVSYPYRKLYINLNVVGSTYTYANNQNINSETYYYNNAVVHSQGGGFKGFSKITTYDNIRNIKVEQTFDPTKMGIPLTTVSPTVSEAYIYSVSIASNKIAKVLLTSKTTNDLLNNNKVLTSYTYDSYGSVLTETIDYGDNNIHTTLNSYNNLTGLPYLLGELIERTVEMTNLNGKFITKATYGYDAKHLLISHKKYYNSNLINEESYLYDTNGYLSETKAKSYTSSNWLITKTINDEFGRVTRKTDPLGLYSDFIYNEKNQLVSTKNYKGLTSTNVYDEQGRVIETINPDGNIETISFSWASSPKEALVLKTVSRTGKPTIRVYFDALGREIRTGEQRFDGSYLYTDIIYDNKGRIEKSSLPFKGETALKWNIYGYDTYDRIIFLTYASGKKDFYSYLNNNQTAENKDGVLRTTKSDAIGNVISVTDPAGTLTYNRRPDGQLLTIIAPGNITTSFEYDNYGRQTKIIDPSAGTKSTVYNTDGNVSQQTDANGKVTKFTYDVYNRVTKKEVVGELITSYIYTADGQLQTVTSSNGTGKTFTYDNQMRVVTDKEIAVDGKWMQKTFTYANGITSAITYSSNTGNITTENYLYTNGQLSEIKLNNTTSIWRVTQENDLGEITEAVSGALTRFYGYDEFGLPNGRSIKKGSEVIQSFSYSISAITGNLNWRKDNKRNIQENFTYDNLNRLVGFGGTIITYDANGSITDVSTIGKFEYTNTAKPYAVTGITPYGTAISLKNQSIVYNGLLRPSSITEGAYSASLTYNVGGDRVKMQIKKNDVDDLIRYYIGGRYEVESGAAGSKEKLYLGGDAYSASAVYIKEGSGAWTIYYLGRDYLGSITHIIDGNGYVKQELSYDPWGRLRNPANQQLYAPDSEPTLFIARGYTGHEHLTMYGLINMNARLYDPTLGRFLSPDPFVQAPYLSQNYNRYSYALNNPLRYTDPDGEFLHIIIGAAIGGVVNWAIHGFKFNAKGLGYFAVGAAAGGLTAATGGAVSSLLAGGSFGAGFIGTSAALTVTSSFINGAIVGAASGFAGGLISGTGNSLIDGQKFGKALTTGLVNSAIGAVSGFLVGGIWGGIDAVRDGREFWNGAREIDRQTIANQNLPQIQQQGDYNCGPATAESTTGVSQQTYRNAIGGDPNKTGVSPARLNSEITNKTGRQVRAFIKSLPKDKVGAEQLAAQMKSGSDFYLASGTGTAIDHATALNSITIKTFQKINGDLYYKVIYQVMDPANAQYKNIGANSMKLIYKIFP